MSKIDLDRVDASEVERLLWWWALDTGSVSSILRAERAGGGEGRRVTAAEIGGLAAACPFTIRDLEPLEAAPAKATTLTLLFFFRVVDKRVLTLWRNVVRLHNKVDADAKAAEKAVRWQTTVRGERAQQSTADELRATATHLDRRRINIEGSPAWEQALEWVGERLAACGNTRRDRHISP